MLRATLYRAGRRFGSRFGAVYQGLKACAWPTRYGVRDSLGGREVGQVVLPATPGGSPAARKRQVNIPLTRNNDLPYVFFGARRFCHGPGEKPGDAALGRCGDGMLRCHQSGGYVFSIPPYRGGFRGLIE